MYEHIMARIELTQNKLTKQQRIISIYLEDIKQLASTTPDMILSAMPAKLQNLQEACHYLELLENETALLKSLIYSNMDNNK